MSKKMNQILLLVLFTLLGCSNSNKTQIICDKSTREIIIGIEVSSINSNIVLAYSEIDGRINLTKNPKNEILIFKHLGYESTVILNSKFQALDTLFLEPLNLNQELGSTGIVPTQITSFHIQNEEVKNIESENSISKEREVLIQSLQFDLNKFYKNEFGKLWASFEVDNNGTIRTFKLMFFDKTNSTRLNELYNFIQREGIDSNRKLGKILSNKSSRGNPKSIKYVLPLNLND